MKSNICPYYVQGMSNLCLGTGSVQFLSPLGQNSVNPPQISHEGGQRLDLKIQSLSRYCPKIYEIEIFRSGHTLDRCWTCKNCDQGSHFGLLKIKICVWTEIGQSFYIDRPWTKLGFQFWTLTLTILVDKCWTTIGLGHTLDKIWIFPAPLCSRDLMQT